MKGMGGSDCVTSQVKIHKFISSPQNFSKHFPASFQGSRWEGSSSHNIWKEALLSEFLWSRHHSGKILGRPIILRQPWRQFDINENVQMRSQTRLEEPFPNNLWPFFFPLLHPEKGATVTTGTGLTVKEKGEGRLLSFRVSSTRVKVPLLLFEMNYVCGMNDWTSAEPESWERTHMLNFISGKQSSQRHLVPAVGPTQKQDGQVHRPWPSSLQRVDIRSIGHPGPFSKQFT